MTPGCRQTFLRSNRNFELQAFRHRSSAAGQTQEMLHRQMGGACLWLIIVALALPHTPSTHGAAPLRLGFVSPVPRFHPATAQHCGAATAPGQPRRRAPRICLCQAAPKAEGEGSLSPPPFIPSLLPSTDGVPPASPDKPHTQRVGETVRALRQREAMFGKYARDISGKTGLGAIAALAYIRNVIEKRESVWGDLLTIVFQNKPGEIEQCLQRCSRKVLSAPIDPDEWVWFRDNLLSTYVWFERSPSQPGYLYEWLTILAKDKVQEQAALVEHIIYPLLEQIPSQTLLPGGDDECRQDSRVVGMSPDIREQLLGTRENAMYYDLNVYLSKLVCMSKVINPEFQSCIEGVFRSLEAPYVLQQGAPKSMARCKAKAQTEYSSRSWPTTAHLIDTIRCTVIFPGEEELREGFLHLMRASGAWAVGDEPKWAARVETPSLPPQFRENRLSVARVKNGFRKGKGGYRDVKVNVVFLSIQGFAMIGEVAFVVEGLLQYKHATHELYEIIREQDFFEEVVTAKEREEDATRRER